MKYLDYFDSFLNEGLNQKLMVLKNYLTKPDSEKEAEFKKLFPDKNYNGSPTPEDYKIAMHDGPFKTIRKDSFGKDKVVNRGYPSHYYFTYSNDIPKERWLVHFSNNAYKIFKDQKFKIGMSDYKYIGYTNRQSNKGKLRGGYNFGYLLRDSLRYGLAGNSESVINVDGKGLIKYKSYSHYGNDIIIFRASGIKVKSWLGDEPQVIFMGDEAKNINLITNIEGKWVIKTNKATINPAFFKSFWEEYIKPYSKDNLKFGQKLFDYEDLFKFDNLKDVFKFFENDYDKYKKYLN